MASRLHDKLDDNKRKYDSPLRRQQVADTRERIVDAGAELVHELPSWDWTNLTAKAVGDRAGVASRTVLRYFSSERVLRHAVLQRLVEESETHLERFALKDFREITEGMLAYLLSFSAKFEPPPLTDPTLNSIAEYRRDKLLEAVTQETRGWQEREREIATACLDILWDPSIYERIKHNWSFDRETATRSITWLIELIEAAISTGQRP